MEIKNWTYEEYPSFDEEIEGVTRIPTTGDEKGTYIYSNMPTWMVCRFTYRSLHHRQETP